MAERISARLVKSGVLLVALGPIPALMGALEIVAIPGVAVASHVTMMMAGVLLMCLGLVWQSRVRLDETWQLRAFWLLVVGLYGAAITGVLAALVGVGGDALPALVHDTYGSPGEESLLWFASRAAGVLVLGGLALVGWGVIRDVDAERHSAADRVATWFVQMGLFLPVLAILLTLWGDLTPWNLPVVTPVGLAILGLVSLVLGLMWDEMRLEASVRLLAFGLVAAGAVGALATGVFVTSQDLQGDALAGSYTGLFGSQGVEFAAQLGALVATLAVAVGIAIFWHGVPKAPPRIEGALTVPVNEHVSAQLRRRSALLLLLSVVSALLPSMARAPRVALGTAATGMIVAPLLMCFGLMWSRVRLSENRQLIALRALSWGGFGVLISGIVLGLLGIGGETLSVSSPENVGSPGAEFLARIVVDLSALLIAVGMIMVWFGVRSPATQPTWGRRVARITGYAVAVLALEAVIYHVMPNVLFGDTYPLQLMDYEYGARGRVVRLARITDADGGRLVFEDDTLYADQEAQGWTPDEWQWFYHASQGGAFELPVRYDWIMALEQPVVPLWPRSQVGLLMDPGYLARFGFLSNPTTSYDSIPLDSLGLHRDLMRYSRINAEDERNNNPASLPVGFARAENWVDHATGESFDAMGFTCAACHTGQVDWIRPDSSVVRVRIEGGPATVDLGKFRSAVGISLALTRLLPGRFDRFAARVHRADLAAQVEGLVRSHPVTRGQPDSLRSRLIGEIVAVVRETPTSDLARLAEADGPLVDPFERAGAAGLRPAMDTLLSRRMTGEEKGRLRDAFDALLDRGRTLRALQDSLEIYPTEEGFARLDATGRAANFILGNSLGRDENYQVANAPVNFPHIWDAPWFEWVQYNASFQQPMMRNAAEGLGVFAAVDLKGSGPTIPADEDPLLFASSMDVISIHEMEKLLAGPGAVPFSGLRSPRWPTELLGLDAARVERGARLYRQRCALCHLPGSSDSIRTALLPGGRDSTSTPSIFEAENWTERDGHGRRYLKTPVIDFAKIGTDPFAAANFRNRTVYFGDLGERLGLSPRVYSYSEALSLMVGEVKESRYRALGLPSPEDSVTDSTGADPARLELDGYRGPTTQAPLGYRARPLNGVWATPPFLHNGAVPTLYQVLSPQDERPERFWLGSRRFDPDSIGFDYSESPGAFEFDTSLDGNSNKGHLFEGDTVDWDYQGRIGVVGPYLEPEQRMDIIEYLKSLPPLPQPSPTP